MSRRTVGAARQRTRCFGVSLMGVALAACSDGSTTKTADPGAGGIGGQSSSAGGAAASGAGGIGGLPGSGGAIAAAGAGGIGGEDSSGGATAAGGAGCGSESFRAIYSDIFADTTNSCTSAPCHGRTMRLEDVGNLDLSTPEIAYEALVGKTSDSAMCAGKPRVNPGDAQGSLLVTKLRDATVECGTSMPAGSPIDDASLKRIVDWINDGACNN